jgi:hypothetical protein
MEYRHSNNTTDEHEIIEVLWIDVRHGIDLERIRVLSGELKETVLRIEHLVR